MDEITTSLNEYETWLNKRLFSSSSASQDKQLDNEIVKIETNINSKLSLALEQLKNSANQTVSNQEEKVKLEKELNEQKEQLKKLAERYYLLKNNFIEKQTKILKKTYLVVHPGAGDKSQEINNINYTDQLALFDYSDDIDIKNLYINIRQRHNDILKLEADIRYLQQLFITAGILIKNQGDIVIRIEDTMGIAVADTAAAVVELRMANDLKSQQRRKLVCLLVTVIIVIMIIVIPIISVKH
jgi:t-SNARE complex subunit (syntaxin)